MTATPPLSWRSFRISARRIINSRGNLGILLHTEVDQWKQKTLDCLYETRLVSSARKIACVERVEEAGAKPENKDSRGGRRNFRGGRG